MLIFHKVSSVSVFLSIKRFIKRELYALIMFTIAFYNIHIVSRTELGRQIEGTWESNVKAFRSH